MLLRLLSAHSTTACTLLKAGFGKNLPSLFWFSTRHKSGIGHEFAGSNEKASSSGKASEEQLAQMENELTEAMQHFFFKTHKYELYTPGVIFEDNIRNIRTTGLGAYMKQMSTVRFLGHLRYAHLTVNLLQVYSDPIESSIKIRWRVDGVSGYRILLVLWKLNLFKFKEEIHKKDQTDGFSIFYVNSDGKIWKHIVDNMVPDEEHLIITPEKKTLAAKIAAALSIGWSGAQSVSEML